MKFSLGKPKPLSKLMTSVMQCRRNCQLLLFIGKELFMLTSLALIFLVGLSMAAICQKCRLPRIVGMLLTGIVLGPYVLDWLDPSILSISAELRKMALIIIL